MRAVVMQMIVAAIVLPLAVVDAPLIESVVVVRNMGAILRVAQFAWVAVLLPLSVQIVGVGAY